jgi:transcriptional regulator with PAS, ATPase and Fis domain
MSNDDFIAVSKQMIEVKRIVNLVKGIKVNTIIIGESGTGKSKVASSILPNAIIVNAEDNEETARALKNFSEVIIENFDKVRNFDALHIQNQKIVATATKRPKDSVIDKFFGIVIDVEPLVNRAEDIEALMAHFLVEAKESLKIDCEIDSKTIIPDITQNCHSLKRGVYKRVLNDTMNEETLVLGMSEFFYTRVEMDDNYSHFLKLFDTAIIQANSKKYKSQLMMSYKMGINRNTLRKKINELGLKLDE